MTKRRKKPETVHDMARRRGLTIHKAKKGGWYVRLVGLPWSSEVVYAATQWRKVIDFVKTQPCIIKTGDI